eukprot:Awhi_evm1s10524
MFSLTILASLFLTICSICSASAIRLGAQVELSESSSYPIEVCFYKPIVDEECSSKPTVCFI